MAYNPTVAQHRGIERKKLAIAGLLTISLGLLMGASCEKSKAKSDDYPGATAALDRAEGVAPPETPTGPPPPNAGSPDAPGIDVSKLDAAGKARFGKLLDVLPSPCGKPHSLRKSIEEDVECKRAPFAGNYVVMLVREELDDGDLRSMYDARFRQTEKHSFSLDNRPMSGRPNAPVVIVEFFDFGCPHCAMLAPILDEVAKLYPDQVTIYYKNFPLSHNPDGVPAAKAAIAAHRQGKFKAMHDLLFANQGEHDKQALFAYAAKIGLDMARFEADFTSADIDAQITQDRKEALEAELQGTPTVYINGREFTDPAGVAFFKDWIDEELAAAR